MPNWNFLCIQRNVCLFKYLVYRKRISPNLMLRTLEWGNRFRFCSASRPPLLSRVYNGFLVYPRTRFYFCLSRCTRNQGWGAGAARGLPFLQGPGRGLRNKAGHGPEKNLLIIIIFLFFSVNFLRILNN